MQSQAPLEEILLYKLEGETILTIFYICSRDVGLSLKILFVFLSTL